MLVKTTLILFVLMSEISANIMITNRKISIENVLPCPDNDQLESPIRNVKFRAYNRTHKALSYDITYHRPIDEKIGGTAVVERWGNAGWVKIPFLPFHSDICNTMHKLFPTLWIEQNKNMGVKHPELCPIPPGNYSLRNYLMDMDSVKIPYYEGKFRVKMMYQIEATRKTIFCNIHLFVSKAIL